MIINLIQQKNSDSLGALASGLCLIHCVTTPFLFIAQTCSATCCETAPNWWKAIDYIFIIISFISVYWSTKQSSKIWVAIALWLSWTLLFLALLNEKITLINLPETSIYIPAIALVTLHLYNRKYCKCKDEECCLPIR